MRRLFAPWWPDRSIQTLIVLAVPLSVVKKVSSVEMRKILKESSFALMVCALAGMVAGVMLSSMTGMLEAVPGLLVIIPGALAMRGNIFGSLGSRLGTSLHSGQLDPNAKNSSVLFENVLAVVGQTLLLSTILGALAFIFIPGGHLTLVYLLSMILISVLAGIFAGAMLLGVTLQVAIGGFKKGWDPDNVVAPVVTTAGDILTIPCVLLATYIVLWLGNGAIILLSFCIIICTVVYISFFLTRKVLMRTILRQSFLVLVLCAFLATVAGHFLEARLESLIVVSGLLILFPPFNDTLGNLGAILSSRLSSAAHMGTTRMKAVPDSEAFHNMAAVFFLLLMIFPAIGILAHFTAVVLGFTSPGILTMMLVSILAGVLVSVIAITASYYFTYLSYRVSVDPDNVVIPIMTSLMDMVGVFVLLSVLLFMGVI